MIRCIARIPQLNDAVSLYRGVGPLSELHRQIDFTYATAYEFSWSTIAGFDLVYIVRPCTNHDRGLVDMAKKMQRPVWIDFDDDILDVPPSNLTHNFYSNEGVKANVRHILQTADVCTVSTEYLAKKLNPFRPVDKPCVVVPNAFPDHLFNWDQKDVPRNNIISWRGSRTHDRDLNQAHGFFDSIKAMLPHWKFVFLGEPAYQVHDWFPANRRRVIPSMDIIEYFHTFKALGSTFHVVPLEENDFNRAKSNIAWIEATWAGAATIAPYNMDEWQKPGILHSPFFGCDSALFTDASVWQDAVKKSRAYIEKNLLLSHVNKQRARILESFK